MKFSNLQAFDKHLKDASPAHFVPIYMILVKEDYEREQCEQKLTQAILDKKTPSEQERIVFQGEKASTDQIFNELNSTALFVKRRVVIIRQADDLTKPLKDKLENYFSNPNPSVFLILSAATVNRATNFYKKGEQAGIILDIPEEKPWEKENALVQKMTEELKAQGKSIDLSTCRFLVKYVSNNQAILHHEINKLICYLGERTSITTDDIRAICTGIPNESIWQLGDAIFQRKSGEALRIANAHLADGQPIFALIRQIRSQFQNKFQICSLITSGGGPPDVQRLFPYMKGKILQSNIQTAVQYGLERFRQGILAIDETELLGKNSSLPYELLIERLILKLTT